MNKNKLIETCKKMAESLLKEFGEFYPFAFALDVNNDIVPITTDPYNDFPSSEIVVTQLEEEIKISDSNFDYCAVAICVDVLYTPNDSTQKTDALQIRIDQRFYNSYNIYIPYKKNDDNTIVFGSHSPEKPGDLHYFDHINEFKIQNSVNKETATLNGNEIKLTTTYLIKEAHAKTYHFRATVENNGIFIIQGVFYKWLSKSWEDCGNNEKVIIRQKKLVDEKLNEGYKIVDFSEILENTVDIYDKAKWHFDGDFPKDLNNFQGYVHTGMFLGWLIEKNLVSDEFKNKHKKEIEQFKKRELTGSQIFEKCCNGVLSLAEISELGNRFSLAYYNFGTGEYLKDYEITLLLEEPTLYHVEDTWENYFKIEKVLTTRLGDWKAEHSLFIKQLNS